MAVLRSGKTKKVWTPYSVSLALVPAEILGNSVQAIHDF